MSLIQQMIQLSPRILNMACSIFLLLNMAIFLEHNFIQRKVLKQEDYFSRISAKLNYVENTIDPNIALERYWAGEGCEFWKLETGRASPSSYKSL